MQDRNSPVLFILAFAGAFAVGAACSTVADPPDPEVPICECDIGERLLDCSMGKFEDGTNAFVQVLPLSAGSVCIDEEASEQDQEDACMDACEVWLAGAIGHHCDFLANDDPHAFHPCAAPVPETSGEEPEDFDCPSWYLPTTYVTNYSGDSNEATVDIDATYVSRIRSELTSLYACDDGLYVESPTTSDWEFDGLSSGELLYELGLRDGDKNAKIWGWDPVNDTTTTSMQTLDSPSRMHAAHRAVMNEDGVKITVERSGAPGGDFDIYVTID